MTWWSSIAGSVFLLFIMVGILVVYLHKRLKRTSLWQRSTETLPVIHSAPISRRASSKGVASSIAPCALGRTRSASFGEDLPARLQILTPGTTYQSYSPAPNGSSARAARPSLGASVRLSTTTTPATLPSPTAGPPSISLQLRYEPAVQKLLPTIFQLHSYTPLKNTQGVFLILYLLPNEDQQRQTHVSANGTFNQCFEFPLRPDEVQQRTLRLTAYTVDSTTRVRATLGHAFVKLDKFLDKDSDDTAFFTDTMSYDLTSDLRIRPDHLGQLVLTNSYVKEQNALQIRIQQLNHLHVDPIEVRFPLKAHFSAQTPAVDQEQQWTIAPSFLISSFLASRVDQEFNLKIDPADENPIACHLRLHFNNPKQIHSHARWQQSLHPTSPTTVTVPLVAY